jgi:hypothetical protein
MITSIHRSNDRSATGGKRQRKVIALEDKLDVIRRYEHNECMVNIAKSTEFQNWPQEPLDK